MVSNKEKQATECITGHCNPHSRSLQRTDCKVIPISIGLLHPGLPAFTPAVLHAVHSCCFALCFCSSQPPLSLTGGLLWNRPSMETSIWTGQKPKSGSKPSLKLTLLNSCLYSSKMTRESKCGRCLCNLEKLFSSLHSKINRHTGTDVPPNTKQKTKLLFGQSVLWD